MAQLKNTLISGDLRVTGTIYGYSKTDHTHGVITSTGYAGTASNKALYTVTSGSIAVGTLPVAAGGTGVATITSGQLLIGNGTSAISTRAITNNGSSAVTTTGTNIPTMSTLYYGLAVINNATQQRSVTVYAPTGAGTAGQLLISAGGTSAPTWTNTASVTVGAATKLGSSTVGSDRQPIYLNSGSPTAGNYTVAHRGNAGKSNMNDIGRLHASVGMTQLADPGNTVDNPGNGTSWHHYIDISYTDDPNNSNAWVTQFANKAGTTDLWMRSRSGGTITNGTAWTAPWIRVLTETNAGQGLNNNITGLNLLPQSQDMQGYNGTENRADTPFPWCYSHSITGTANTVDLAYNSVVTPETNTWYTLSFYAKASAEVEIINHFYGGSGTTVAQGYNSDGNTTTTSDGNIKSIVGTTWKRYWVCYKTGTNTSGAKNLIFGRLTNKEGIVLYIALPKFEKGQIATGWTPNPGDAYHLYGRAGNTNILYNGGGSTAADYSLILHGNSTNGSSGIAFLSGKGNTTINYPSDRAFIQFHPYGITTAAAEGSAPTLATSGEANRLVIGVGNDATDQVWLQTPGTNGLIHQVGATSYVIPAMSSATTTANYPVISTTTSGVYQQNTSITMNGGTISATTFSGNATSATKATNDSDGNAINTTYIKKAIGTAKGDIIYWSASGTPARLAAGSNGQVLKLASGVPTWANDTNTDTKVSQSATTTSNWRKVLLHVTADAAATTAVSTATDVVYGAQYISAQPSTGAMRANLYYVTDSAHVEYNSTTKSLDFIFA